jgi:hypothetical protein
MMQATQATFPEWFCLRDGRKNFQIDPARDQAFLFGQPSWEQDTDSRLKRAQLLGTPVRLLWWGQYGIGKTHRLRHTEYLVKHNGYRYQTCYVVATDVQEKTGFERLHYELVNSLDRTQMRQMVGSYLLKVKTQTPGVPSPKEICGNSADVESALKNFGGDNENLVLPAWRFLCGLELKGNDLALAGVTKEQLDSSHDFSAVLGALGNVIKIETGAELLYLIDEAENLLKITNKTASARWQESLRSMLDIHHIGIVMTVGAERFQDVPPLLTNADFVRRMQKDNYRHMEAFKLPDVTSFIKGLLAQWIDPDKRAALETSEGFASSVADYDPEVYPFTAGGFEKYCDYAVVDPRTAKPSEILVKLDGVAAEAFFRGRRLIDKNHLTDMGIA